MLHNSELGGSRPCFSRTDNLAAPLTVFNTISHLEIMYPGFRDWFFEKVASAPTERRVFIEESNSRIIGVAIAKRMESERKLCTLWTDPIARNSGVASKLASRAFDWLQTSHPLFTVPQERMPEFRALLAQWGFGAPRSMVGYYRENRTEYVFNGELRRKLCS